MLDRREKNVVLYDPNHLTTRGLCYLINSHPSLNLLDNTHELEQIRNYDNDNLIILNLVKSDNVDLKLVTSLVTKVGQNILAIVNQENSSLIDKLWKLRLSCIISDDCSEIEINTALKMLSTNQRFYNTAILDIIANSENTISKNSSTLSSRELEVVKLIAKGKSTEKIANELHVSVHTINSHRKNVMKKLEFNSPVELIVYAVKNDLLD